MNNDAILEDKVPETGNAYGLPREHEAKWVEVCLCGPFVFTLYILCERCAMDKVDFACLSWNALIYKQNYKSDGEQVELILSCPCFEKCDCQILRGLCLLINTWLNVFRQAGHGVTRKANKAKNNNLAMEFLNKAIRVRLYYFLLFIHSSTFVLAMFRSWELHLNLFCEVLFACYLLHDLQKNTQLKVVK